MLNQPDLRPATRLHAFMRPVGETLAQRLA